MNQLELEIKQLIIKTLNLEDYSPDDIQAEAPLFGEGLGLDSIDALELGVELQKQYGISFKGGGKENKEHFYSVASLANFIQQNRSK
jgi:acyl carrier protein